MEELPLSRFGAASGRPSPVNRMMAAFATGFRDGVDVNLGVGYVDESAVPRDELLRAAASVSRPDHRHPHTFNYGGPEGDVGLQSALKKHLSTGEGGSVPRKVLDRTRLVVGLSGVTSLLDQLADVVKPGLVVTTDPWYYIFCDLLRRRGFRVHTLPEDPEGLDPRALAGLPRSLGKRAKDLRFFYSVTVSNPTCTILSARRQVALLNSASGFSRRLGRAVPVFFDRAYEGLIHDPTIPPPRSPLGADRWGLAYELGSLSKVMAPTLRIGYLAGPDRPFVDSLVQRTSDGGFSAPMLTQAIARRLLESPSPSRRRRLLGSYRRKAVEVRKLLARHLGVWIEDLRGGQAGFYFYLTFRNVVTSEGGAFFRYLSRTTGDPGVDGPKGRPKPRVSYLPGEFCVNPSGGLAAVGRRQLRLSYGYESVRSIERGIQLIAQAIVYSEEKRK